MADEKQATLHQIRNRLAPQIPMTVPVLDDGVRQRLTARFRAEIAATGRSPSRGAFRSRIAVSPRTNFAHFP
jgi:hypothetical protein